MSDNKNNVYSLEENDDDFSDEHIFNETTSLNKDKENEAPSSSSNDGDDFFSSIIPIGNLQHGTEKMTEAFSWGISKTKEGLSNVSESLSHNEYMKEGQEGLNKAVDTTREKLNYVNDSMIKPSWNAATDFFWKTFGDEDKK